MELPTTASDAPACESPSPSTRRGRKNKFCSKCAARANALDVSCAACGAALSPSLKSTGPQPLAAEQWAASNRLLCAVRADDLIQVRELLGSGACNLEQTGTDGLTALQTAASQGFAVCASLLIEAGAAIDACATTGHMRGCTALMFAVDSGELECVRRLLDSRASCDARDANGKTALDHAWRNNSFEVASLLTEASGLL